ncbi:tetratricopeptide repeat protein [Neorhodopirellula pilleata]|nr:tetratricopeptide repeat protein [Neorhodopirellula pilleata]
MIAETNNTTETREGPGPALVVGVALMLCACWMLVWRGSLDGVFHFDDYGNIVDKEQIRELWPLDDYFRNNRPVGLYSFAINYHFSQLDPKAYLVTNLVIHVVNGLLLFAGCWLAGRLWLRAKHHGHDSESTSQYRLLLTAAIIATLWTLHPLTTQAVTYIVQRYESLASLGYLAAWVGLSAYLSTFRITGCLLILIGSWIGLLSKEVFATAPLAILLFDRIITSQRWLDIIRHRWLPYSLMLTPYAWFIPSVTRFFDPVRTSSRSMGIGIDKLNSWEYLRTQPEVIWHYLSLVIWPKDLCIDYDWKIQTNPLVYLPLGATIVAILLLGGYCYWRGSSVRPSEGSKCSKCGIAGWLTLTFFLILSPTSSVMPIADLAFEHRMYLPSAVVLAGIVLGASVLAARLLASSERPLILKYAFGCILLSCVILLAWRTHLRNLDYRDELTLWHGATQLAPNNARAWHTVGLAYYKRGNKDAALQPLINAVGLSNESIPLFDASLAECLQYLKHHDKAITLYQRALSKKKHYPEVYNDLGAVFFAQGRLDDAQQSFETAIEQKHSEAKYNLALVHLQQQRLDQAVPLLEETLIEQPELHVAARRLAWVLATAEDKQIRDVARAEQLLQQHYDVAASENAYVLDTWAAIQAAQNNFDAAIDSVQQALRLARSKSDESLVEDLTERLASFERREPWIEGSKP